jgi:uncharacterized protein
MAAGWVYVLVNSSMPGLVKVGKTTRPTVDRATELSGVTGVATPFVIAYEQYFTDCDVAEEFVHADLQRRGLRISNNREFFQATTNEIIRVVMQAPGIADVPSFTTTSDSTVETEVSASTPWADVFERAEAHYFGLGSAIQDYREAFKLYNDSKRLGCLKAYCRIGDIFCLGLGAKSDEAKAIESYMEGAKRGYYLCYARMAQVYETQGHIENAVKCWEHFFKDAAKTEQPNSILSQWEYAGACADSIEFIVTTARLRILDSLKTESSAVRQTIIQTLTERLNSTPLESTFLTQRRSMALEWARENISAGIEIPSTHLELRRRRIIKGGLIAAAGIAALIVVTVLLAGRHDPSAMSDQPVSSVVAETPSASEAPSSAPDASQSTQGVADSSVAVLPSFDCRNIHSQVLSLVCSTPALAALDRQLAESYSAALSRSSAPDALRQGERAWIEQRNNSDADVDALAQMYRDRISALNGDSAEAKSQDSGQSAIEGTPTSDDLMRSRFGNTTISRNGASEWHLYFESGGNFTGHEIRTNYQVAGTWTVNEGNLCLSFQPQMPGTPNPDCQPISAHQIGDVWTSAGSAMTLERGIR